MINSRLASIISAALVTSLVLPTPVNAKTNRENLKGGALGIIQCWHITGGKTKVIWQVIVNDENMPIDAAYFSFKTPTVTRNIFEAVIPRTVSYQTTLVFDSLETEVSVTGSAAHLKAIGVHRYSLKDSLGVVCDRLGG